jgi:hypothetical protein
MADYTKSERVKVDNAAVTYAEGAVSEYSNRIYDEFISNIETETLVNVATAHEYLQRVWDTGTVGWCYYTKADLDPAPLAAETTPNWTGVISNHQLIATITG